MQEHVFIVKIWGMSDDEIPEDGYISEIIGEHLEDTNKEVEVSVEYVGSKNQE